MKQFLFISILIALFSCKKDTVKDQITPPAPHVDLIAPCALNDSVFDIDSVYHGTSVLFPTAPFSVKFKDTTNGPNNQAFLEFAFNKVPTTGMYYLVKPANLGIVNLENQISFIGGNPSFHIEPSGTYDNIGAYSDIIYVENNQNELIISYCHMPDSVYYYNSSQNSFIGNGPGYKKYTKVY